MNKINFRWKITPILISIMLGMVSCGLFDKSQETVDVSVEGELVRITNNTSSTIYYFIGEGDYLTTIDWFPDCIHHPSIRSEHSAAIPFGNIPNGKSVSTKHGDKVIVYWWNSSYKDLEDLHFVSITL